jgi:hypothetical protein
MDRKHAFDVFGGPVELAHLMGLRRQTVYAWPEKLPPKTVDRLIGLAFRHGKVLELVGASKLDTRPDASPES